MNGKHLLIGMKLFLVMCGACLAAPSIAGGVVPFSGAVVDPNCASRVGKNSTFEFNSCPSRLGGKVLSVQPSRTALSLDHASINVRKIGGSVQNGRLFDQQYQLVDGKGKPVRSGAYLITLTSP